MKGGVEDVGHGSVFAVLGFEFLEKVSVEVVAAPFGGVLAGVTVKDGKVALTDDAGEIVDKGVRVFHRSPAFPVSVFRDADDEGSVSEGCWCRVPVDGLSISERV